MTKYHRLGGLNNRNVFLTVLEAGKSKTKMPADLVLGEDSLPGFLTAAYLLCLPQCGREREKKLSPVSLNKGTNPIMRAPPSVTSSNPHCLPKAHLQILSY